MDEFAKYYGRVEYNGARVVWFRHPKMDRPVGCIDNIPYATLFGGRIELISSDEVIKVAMKMGIEISDPSSQEGREALWNGLLKRE